MLHSILGDVDDYIEYDFEPNIDGYNLDSLSMPIALNNLEDRVFEELRVNTNSSLTVQRDLFYSETHHPEGQTFTGDSEYFTMNSENQLAKVSQTPLYSAIESAVPCVLSSTSVKLTLSKKSLSKIL